jgi:hypothetical protein
MRAGNENRVIIGQGQAYPWWHFVRRWPLADRRYKVWVISAASCLIVVFVGIVAFFVLATEDVRVADLPEETGMIDANGDGAPDTRAPDENPADNTKLGQKPSNNPGSQSGAGSGSGLGGNDGELGGGNDGGSGGDPDDPAGGCPAFPAFPDANCTGWQHTGITLSAYTGPTTVATSGTIIDSKHITNSLCITGDKVTIKRSKIEGVIWLGSGDAFGPCPSASVPTDITFEDLEVVGPGTASTHDADIASTFAISGSNFTCTRCNVHRWGSGFYVRQNVRIEDSYIHDTIGYVGCHPNLGPDCIAHRSCIGGNGAVNATYRHNNLQCNNLNGEEGVSGAIVVYSQSGFLPAQNVLVEKNLLSGQGASYCLYAGTGDVPPSNVQIINNRFSRTYHAQCGQFGPYIAASSGVTLSGNAYTDGVAIN